MPETPAPREAPTSARRELRLVVAEHHLAHVRHAQPVGPLGDHVVLAVGAPATPTLAVRIHAA